MNETDETIEAHDYDARVANPNDGVEIVFTVMQPALAAGQSAPLILHGHGFGGARLPNRYDRSVYEQLSGGILPSTEAARRASASGYFVISFDQRGFGDSGGYVEVMDPEIEGADVSAIIDWAENDMPHRQRLARRDGALLLGGLGLSYGGAFQLIGACVDARFTAIVPTAAWYDLSYSLAPDNVVKTAWGAALVALGVPTSGVQLDWRLYRALLEGLAAPLTGRGLSTTISDWLYNSSPASFYNGDIARDGEHLPSSRRAPTVDALLVQGVGDTLFNLNEAVANADALSAAGNDVRVIAMQYGHSLPFLQDIDRIAYQTDAALRWADEYLETARIELDYLDEKLKGAKAEYALPRCLMILDEHTTLGFDAIPVGDLQGDSTYPFSGTARSGGLDLLYNILRRQSLARIRALVSGAARNTWEAITGLFDSERSSRAHDTALIARLVNALPSDHLDELVSGGSFIAFSDIADDHHAIAGIPQARLHIDDAHDNAIAFVGLGVRRPGCGTTELLNKQVRPIRGGGTRHVELNGVSFRLRAGDTLGLLVYGYHPQYIASFSARSGTISVSGEVALPLIDMREH